MKTKACHTEQVDLLIKQMRLEEKLDIIIETSPENQRLGIPKYYHGNEALHGVVRPGRFTVFPQAIALGAMFDDELLQKIADAISSEARARYHNKCADDIDEREFEGRYNGLLAFWSPNLNIARDPRWGRTAETYGEDPFLAGKCGAAFVRGLQGEDENYLKAISTPKHFTANNEEHNRFECNAKMSEKSLREFYLEPFRLCLEESEPEAVMAAYNAINGLPCHANPRLLQDILREEWGFEGYVVSDCSAVARLWDSHKSFEEPIAAAAAAINSGIDLECGGYSQFEHLYKEFLPRAVSEGLVPIKRLDEAVRRVLTARVKVGQFAKDSLPWAELSLDTIGCEAHSRLSYEAALKSAVLLKNDEILPLNKNSRLVVVGNNAQLCQFGDYSGKPKNPPVSIIEGIKKHSPDAVLVEWAYAGPSEAFTVIPDYCYFTEDGSSGIAAAFYDNALRAGTARCRIDASLNYEWLKRYPDPLITTAEFSCLFKGKIKAPLSGQYRLRLSAGGYKSCCPPELYIDNSKYEGEPLSLKKGECVSFCVTYSKQLENPFIRLEWTTPTEIKNEELFSKELEAAKGADCVIAVLGLGTEYESEGRDKTDLRLPAEQLELLRRIYTVNKNIVLVLQNGSALDLSEASDLSRAILEAWYPGDRGGDAIGDLLFGRVSPSGRLPLAFPRRTEDLPPFDDYDTINGRSYMYRKIPPLYDFGFGLSYTSFEYSQISLDKDCIRVKITNTGKMAADEVAQLYIDSAGLSEQPRLRLRGFKRLSLQPQESREISFPLSADSFALFDKQGKKRLFEGEYRLYIDGHLPDKSSMRATVLIHNS